MHLRCIGPSHYVVEVKMTWVTSKWQTFMPVVLILLLLKTMSYVLYNLFPLKYFCFFICDGLNDANPLFTSVHFKHEQRMIFQIIEYEFVGSGYLVCKLNLTFRKYFE